MIIDFSCGCHRNATVYFPLRLVSSVIEAGSNEFQGLGVPSAVPRVISKLVYRFGISISEPQTLKRVKINSSKNRQMIIHALAP